MLRALASVRLRLTAPYIALPRPYPYMPYTPYWWWQYRVKAKRPLLCTLQTRSLPFLFVCPRETPTTASPSNSCFSPRYPLSVPSGVGPTRVNPLVCLVLMMMSLSLGTPPPPLAQHTAVKRPAAPTHECTGPASTGPRRIAVCSPETLCGDRGADTAG